MEISNYDLVLSSQKHPKLVTESVVTCNSDMLTNPQEVANFFSFLREKAEERVYVMALNTKGKGLGFSEISHGTAEKAIVSPKDIFTRLLLLGARHFVLVHNHPSGDPQPSNEDIYLTKRVAESGKLLDVKLTDHIVIGMPGYCSFREIGLI